MAASHASTLSPERLEGTYRRNFVAFLADGVLFTVAMGLISSTTVLPEYVRRLTDSDILIGLTSSMFEVGWLLPQLFMARYLVQVARKSGGSSARTSPCALRCWPAA